MEARADSLSWDIVDLKYVFSLFNAEKLLSPEATVTGRVRRSLRAMLKLGYISRTYIYNLTSDMVMRYLGERI